MNEVNNEGGSSISLEFHHNLQSNRERLAKINPVPFQRFLFVDTGDEVSNQDGVGAVSMNF